MTVKTRPLTYEEYFAYTAEFLPLTAALGTNFATFELKIAKDALFKLKAISYIADDARIRARFSDTASGRYLQKGNPDMRALAGRPLTGAFSMTPHLNEFIPYKLGTPYKIPAASIFRVEASDDSNASNNARITFHGAKVREGAPPWARAYRFRSPFIYEIDLGAIAANGAAIGILSTDTDSDFLVESVTGVRTGSCTILIAEGARGRDWMDRATHFDNMVGMANFPNDLLKQSPRFIARGGTISVNVTDLSGASNTVRVYFIGVKLYGPVPG